jgi:hypothetical protein
MSTGRLLAVIFAAVAAVCVVAGIGAALAPSPKDDKPAVSGTTNEALPAQTATPTTAAATSTAPAAPVGPKTSFGDGTWEIGAAAGQVAPGKYRTTVPTTSSNCYWERLKGTSGGFDDIIANDNADPGTPTVVTIGAQDVAFKSRGCGTWAKA